MKKLILIFIAAVLTFSLASCGGNDNDGATSDYATSDSANKGSLMSFDDVVLNEPVFKFIASMRKDYYINTIQQQYPNYTEEQILALPYSETKTFADIIKEEVILYCQEILIIEKMCKDASIELTELQAQEIDDIIGDIQDRFGGEDLFEIKLSELGFSREALMRYLSFDKLYNLLYEDRYGKDGSARIPEANVHKYFIENFYSANIAFYSFYNSDGSLIEKEYTDEAISKYFNENYVKVEDILFSVKGLTEEQISEKKADAEAVYAAIASGEITFDEAKADNDDGFAKFVFAQGENELFQKDAFEMSIGEIRFISSKDGFHIIKKVEKTNEDLFGTVNEDGAVVGSIKNKVTTVMTKEGVKTTALGLIEKLNNGEISALPDTDAKENYYKIGREFIYKNDSNNALFINAFKNDKTAKYLYLESNEGVYVAKNDAFDVKDITSDIYADIEYTLARNAFMEYLTARIDEVSINYSKIESINIVDIPSLEDSYYIG